MVGEQGRGNAQGPPARTEMLERRGNVALFTDPVSDLGIHAHTVAMRP
jgi:hypothetical protein